jgi:hypothetical protein
MTRTATDVRAALATLQAAARRYGDGMNEGAEGFNPHAAKIRQLEDELDRLAETEYETGRQAELAAWTSEVTQQRRAAWNTWVQARHRTPAEIDTWLRAQGWGLEDLKTAITRHGL